MDDALRRWVEANAEGRVVGEERPAVGGSRELYLVDVERHDGIVVPLVLRCEGGGSFSGTEISPAREAVVYRALAGTAVPTPRVLALAPDGAAMLMERIPGSADLPPLRTDARTATMRSFTDALATLHALDIDSLALPGFPRPRTAEDHARFDLELWARLAANGVPVLDPLLQYAGAWLWSHAPTLVARTVLVQGDTGPGNFLADGGVVTGLVDWEFAHLGDPMDDWAWVEMRADAEEIPALHDRYTRATGIPIDPDRLSYYRIAVDYRCAITTSLAVSRGGGARGWAPYLLMTQRYLDGIATRLSARLGVDEPGEEVDSPPSPHAQHFEVLLDGIRTAVRHVDDAEVREQTRNLQILVRFLRAHDELGAEIEARDRADRAATFDEATDDARLAQLVDTAGRVGDERVLRYLLRRHRRERRLWASLLDRPARG